MSTLKSFRVGIDPVLLQKARDFFNATLPDIFNEILQNARRAGATRVSIDIDPSSGTLAVTDDGIGIFHGGVSLNLGGSGWDDRVKESESPAGCGLFSLASRGATIESRGIRIHLDENRFGGLEDVPIETGANIAGTRISFAIDDYERRAYREFVESAAFYYPLPVCLNGEPVERANFLDRAIYTRDWRGLAVGVVRATAGEIPRINFHGLCVKTLLPSVEISDRRYLTVAIDVRDCPELRLVLPARKEVVRDGFFEELLTECYRTIFLYIAERCAAGQPHRLTYKRWVQARDLGVRLPEAEAILASYVPALADENDRFRATEFAIDGTTLLVDLDLDPPDAHSFWRGYAGAGLPYCLADSDGRFRGYSWYDRLPALTGVRFEKFSESGGSSGTGDTRPGMITALCTVTFADCSTETFTLATDVMFEGEIYTTDLREITIHVARDSAIAVAELAELLEESYFYLSDDPDSDSHERQIEDFREGAIARAIEVLLSEGEAKIERVRSLVERHLRWCLPRDRDTTIRFDADDRIAIVFGEVRAATGLAASPAPDTSAS